MKWKFIGLVTVFFILGSFSGAFAADDVITIDQAKQLADKHSRNLTKYELSEEIAKYQLYQAIDQLSDNERINNNLMTNYDSLQRQLSDAETDEEKAEIQSKLDDIWAEIDEQYDKTHSLMDNREDAEQNYDDSVDAQKKYQNQLENLVEQQYTTILIQEQNLQALNEEYALDLSLLDVEKARLQLGSSNQSNVDKLSLDIKNLDKQIIDLNNSIKTLKGNLNDLMGKDFDDDLTVVGFEVPEEYELPELDALLTKATQNSDALATIEQDIKNQKKDLNYSIDSYSYDHDIKEKNLDIAELQLEDEKVKLKESINNLMAAVKTKQEDYQIALKNYQNAQRSYEWDKKRYELGQLSKFDLIQSELNYINTKNKNISAGYAFYLAYRNLELAENGIL